MNERTKRLNDPNDFVVISSQPTGGTIEVFPGYSVAETRTRVELTNGCMVFLKELSCRYFLGEISATDVLNELNGISSEFPGYRDMVEDKLFYEFSKLN